MISLAQRGIPLWSALLAALATGPLLGGEHPFALGAIPALDPPNPFDAGDPFAAAGSAVAPDDGQRATALPTQRRAIELGLVLRGGLDSNAGQEQLADGRMTDAATATWGLRARGAWRLLDDEHRLLRLRGDLTVDRYPQRSDVDLEAWSLGLGGRLRRGAWTAEAEGGAGLFRLDGREVARLWTLSAALTRADEIGHWRADLLVQHWDYRFEDAYDGPWLSLVVGRRLPLGEGLALDASLGALRQQSDAAAERYWGLQGGLRLGARPAPPWRLSLGASAEWRRFDRRDREGERLDQALLRAELAVERALPQGCSLGLRLRHSQRLSTWADEEYLRQQVLIELGWSF